MKECRSCFETKPFDEFHKNSKNRDGVTSYCKVCNRAKSSKWKKDNPESGKKWKASLLERNPSYYTDYRVKNRERDSVNIAEWARKNKSRRVLNQQKRRAAEAAGGAYTLEEWNTLCEKYDNKCLACGDKPESLSVDHVVPISKGGLNTIDNIQPLCLPCNIRKHTTIIDYREEG